jgi:hypothetical protein
MFFYTGENNHSRTPTKAPHLPRIIAHPHILTLLHISTKNRHPLGDIIKRHGKPTFSIYIYGAINEAE